jgi:hypothetical protein
VINIEVKCPLPASPTNVATLSECFDSSFRALKVASFTLVKNSEDSITVDAFVAKSNTIVGSIIEAEVNLLKNAQFRRLMVKNLTSISANKYFVRNLKNGVALARSSIKFKIEVRKKEYSLYSNRKVFKREKVL